MERNTSSSSDYGGYGHHFMARKLEKYTCTICTKVFRDPHLTACCGQHFCDSCLNPHWLEGIKTCPYCREKNFQHIIDKKFKREIDSLVVKCPNLKEGCKRKMELRSLKDHLESSNGCPYALVECSNMCKTVPPKTIQVNKIMRKDLSNHLKDHCPMRLHECEHCGQQGTYHFIARPFGHYTRCKEMPQRCPNNCGEESIKRKDISAHRRQCPLELLDCPFRDAGCKIRLLQSDMARHMESSVQDHGLLTARAFSEIKKRTKAVSINVIQALSGYEPCKRSALESIRAILDDSYYLRDVGDQLLLTTFTDDPLPASGSTLTDDDCFDFDTPPFYFGKGYKMKVHILLVLSTKSDGSGHDDAIYCFLYMLQGEFDDVLEWPLKDNDLAFNLHVKVEDLLPDLDDSFETSPSCGVFSFQTELAICSDCDVSESRDRLGDYCSECPIYESAKQYISREVAQKLLTRDYSLVCTLAVCQHEHIKRRKTETSKEN